MGKIVKLLLLLLNNADTIDWEGRRKGRYIVYVQATNNNKRAAISVHSARTQIDIPTRRSLLWRLLSSCCWERGGRGEMSV